MGLCTSSKEDYQLLSQRVPTGHRRLFNFGSSSPQGRYGTNLANQEPILRHYTMGKKIGGGSFAKVFEAVEVVSGRKVAVKCFPRRTMSVEDDQRVGREVDALASLSHPNIVRFVAYYIDNTHHYIVMELVTGGELFHRLREKGFLPEEEARTIVQELVEAIAYIHREGFVHRDLKPENILLNSNPEQEGTLIKLTDFGFAERLMENALTLPVGSPLYAAPELAQGSPYGKAVDIWSLGIITYTMLAGYPPFLEEGGVLAIWQGKEHDLNFSPLPFSEVCSDAKDFIQRTLIVNPNERATAEQLRHHNWVSSESRARQEDKSLEGTLSQQ